MRGEKLCLLYLCLSGSNLVPGTQQMFSEWKISWPGKVLEPELNVRFPHTKSQDQGTPDTLLPTLDPPTLSHPLPVGGGWEGTEIREAPASLSTLWSELNYRITELPGTQKEQNDFINWNSANSESGGLYFYKSCCQCRLITCCLSKTF